MLTKETAETLYIGKLTTATVIGMHNNDYYEIEKQYKASNVVLSFLFRDFA